MSTSTKGKYEKTLVYSSAYNKILQQIADYQKLCAVYSFVKQKNITCLLDIKGCFSFLVSLHFVDTRGDAIFRNKRILKSLKKPLLIHNIIAYHQKYNTNTLF